MALREFTDERGRRWRAWETRPGRTDHVQEDYADGWIAFECDEEKRRFAPAPQGWDEQPPERLRLLLRCAVPVRWRSGAGG